MPSETVGPGTRLRCAVCGSETIVIKSQEPDLACCGQPLEVTFTPPATAKN
jgi:Desulfoferrodoxin, N-terminal domain